MGVINLGLLVEKIKRKLVNSGFITTNDKATKTAFGIVKVGDNLSVSSGKISVPVATSEAFGVIKPGSGISILDGVISAAAGVNLTLIGELDSPLSGSGTKDITCTEEIDDYSTILLYATNNDGQGATTIIPTSDFITNTSYTLVSLSASGAISNGFIKMKAGDETGKVLTLEAKASTRFQTLKIYGI